MTASIHQPLGLRPRDAAVLGERFGDAYGVYNENGSVDCGEVIRGMGGVCLRAHDDLRFTDSELLTIYDQHDFKVYFGMGKSIRLDNLHYAQAIGHYRLHFLMMRERNDDLPRQAIFHAREGGKTGNQVFAEAYNFALGLTLNRRYFDPAAAASKEERLDLSDRFNIPEYAVKQRVIQLGSAVLNAQ